MLGKPSEDSEESMIVGPKKFPFWKRINHYVLSVMDSRLIGTSKGLESAISIMEGEQTKCLYWADSDLSTSFAMLITEKDVRDFLAVVEASAKSTGQPPLQA